MELSDIEYDNGNEKKQIRAEIYYKKELEWRAIWAKCHISQKPFWVHDRGSATPPGKF
jgi:hypothetical protein